MLSTLWYHKNSQVQGERHNFESLFRLELNNIPVNVFYTSTESGHKQFPHEKFQVCHLCSNSIPEFIYVSVGTEMSWL